MPRPKKIIVDKHTSHRVMCNISYQLLSRTIACRVTEWRVMLASWIVHSEQGDTVDKTLKGTQAEKGQRKTHRSISRDVSVQINTKCPLRQTHRVYIYNWYLVWCLSQTHTCCTRSAFRAILCSVRNLFKTHRLVWFFSIQENIWPTSACVGGWRSNIK